MKSLYVLTSAFDCGKTTTLRHLAEAYGYRTHQEAHRLALTALGDRKEGHPMDRPFRKINDEQHFCPWCKPIEFAQLVLETQRSIENRARDGDLLERGFVDPLEYYERNTGMESAWRWTPVSQYQFVFVLDVMPDLQRPKWGKSKHARVMLARQINHRLTEMYETRGFSIVRVRPEDVAGRALFIHRIIQSD